MLLAQDSAGTMAPAMAKKMDARMIAGQEMPKGLSNYVTEEIFPRVGTKVQDAKPRTAQTWVWMHVLPVAQSCPVVHQDYYLLPALYRGGYLSVERRSLGQTDPCHSEYARISLLLNAILSIYFEFSRPL